MCFHVTATSAEPDAPDAPGEPELADAGSGSRPVFSAPAGAPPNGANGAANGSNGSKGYSWDTSQGSDEVVIPPADLTTEYRLPIFEAVESDWFRRGRSSVSWAPQDKPVTANGNGAGNGAGNENENGNEAASSPSLPQPEPAASSWSSPADEGWQAAAAAAEPSSSGVTTAGLPKRVPRANLVPGTAAAEQPSAPAPARSAADGQFLGYLTDRCPGSGSARARSAACSRAAIEGRRSMAMVAPQRW